MGTSCCLKQYSEHELHSGQIPELTFSNQQDTISKEVYDLQDVNQKDQSAINEQIQLNGVNIHLVSINHRLSDSSVLTPAFFIQP